MIGKHSTKPVPYVKSLAERIVKGIKAGVKLKVIFDSIQDHPDAPRKYDTMMKVYKADIGKARAEIQEEMGLVVINSAKEGDWRAAEFFLKTKAGWSQTINVEEQDPDEPKEETGAIDDLINLLGFTQEDNDPEEVEESKTTH